MAKIVLLTIYDKQDKPYLTCIKTKSQSNTIELFKPGIGKPIKEVRRSMANIRDLLIKANDDGHTIVTNDFKKVIKAFDLPIDDRDYNVYDIHLNKDIDIKGAKEGELLKKIADKIFDNSQLHPYQKLLANSAVVYQDLENKGLLINELLVKPSWSLQTYSGRSKSLEFNIQGYSDPDHISTVTNDNRSVLIHFDWISADLRAAAILSNDDYLASSFFDSDPYTVLMDHINKNSAGGMSRDECKLFMLKSINSMDTNEALEDVYPKLCKWINNIRNLTNDQKGYAKTVLGRKFNVSTAKNALAVLNGAMQGSVAHAMQNVIRQVWVKCNNYVVTDIHDSLVMSVPENPKVINSVIDTVLPLMMFPFNNILPGKHCFPVKVSIGRKWKKWKLYKTVRNLDVTE